MSYTAAGPEPSPTEEAHRQNALSMLFFLCAAFAFQLRFAVSPQVMNKFVGYTGDGGAFYEKLHFGTYAIFLLLPFVLFSRPFQLRGTEIGLFKALMRYSALMLLLFVYLAITGRAGSAGFIIDTYMVAGACGLLMLALSADSRRLLGDITVIMLIISAIIGIVEAVTQHRILPYDRIEMQFRPIGLSVHPLALGALCATAIGFTALTRWRLWVRIVAILALFVGCAASGARTALLLTCVEIVILLLFVPWPRLSAKYQRQAKFVVILLTILAGAVLIGVLFTAGFMNRFSKTIFDENFMARITIYKVFGYVGWDDILFGMKANDLLEIVNTKVHLPFIESTPVVITLLFGLPIALLFVALVFWMFSRLLRAAPLPAWIGTITFMLAALSNNTLSSKTPEIAMLTVLLIAYRGQARSDAPRPAELN